MNITSNWLCKCNYCLMWLAILMVSLSAQVDWKKHPDNPIFNLGAVGTWESDAVAITSVMYDEGIYKAWYAGMNGEGTGCIGYATSEDGISWSRYESNPVLTPGIKGSWDDTNVDHACVIKVDRTYMMWYSGEDTSSYQVGYASSTDGIDWTKYEGNPVLKLGMTGTWDESEVIHPCVIYDGETYHMWYNGYGQDVQRTGYATSPDGVSWTKYTENPVLELGDEGTWDDYMLALMAVIFVEDEYRMWYTGGDGTDKSSKYFRIGYAVSSDGIDWRKYYDNPVLDIGSVGEWDSIGVVTSAVLLDSEAKEYKMWYAGLDGTTSRSGYATSIIVSDLNDNTDKNILHTFELKQNYPNPFNPKTVIDFQLQTQHAASVQVELSIYNTLGQKVVRLVSKKLPIGKYRVAWDASEYPSGVYYYRLIATSQNRGSIIQTRKMLLMK